MNVDRAPIASGTGLRVETFPLAADRDVLREFCDAWFNATVPPEIAVFKPAAPLVLCSVIHYPDMEDELVWKTGAQSQNELYFLVPVARYRVVAGKETLVEYGITTPYIFVDNAASVVAGRERFGFPKQDCRFGSGDSDRPLPWVENEQRWVAMSTWEPTDRGAQLRELLRIVRVPALDRARNPIDIGTVLRGVRMAAQSASAGLESLRGASLEALRSFAGSIRAGMRVSAYNLRQFADPEVEHGASYQDLVRFEMRVREVHTAGLMNGAGEAPFRLELRRVEVTPVAKRLGLHLAPDARVRDPFDALDPIAPFYSRVDVDLVHAERVCWRDDHSGWRTDSGESVGVPARGHARYNDRLGPSAAAFLEHQPPEPTLDVKMTMLAARSVAVATHLATVLPALPHLAIRPVECDGWTAVRLLATRSRRPAEAEAESLVWLDGSYLSIAAPVELTVGDERHRAVFLLVDLTDNGFLLQSMRELALAPTHLGSFSTSGSDWFAQTQPSRCLLRIHALALQRTAAAARLVTSPILDVFAFSSTVAQPIEELPCDALWASIDRALPVLSFGSIAHVDPRRGAVSRRLLSSRYVDHDTRHSSASAPEQLVVQFHDTESFPVFASLGLLELPSDGAVAESIRSPGSGRTRVVPGLRTAEFSTTVRLRSMKVVWQDHGGA